MRQEIEPPLFPDEAGYTMKTEKNSWVEGLLMVVWMILISSLSGALGGMCADLYLKWNGLI